jgi:hypothetical protein
MGPGLGVGGRRGEGDCCPTRRSPVENGVVERQIDIMSAHVDTTRTSSPAAPSDAFSVGRLLVHRIGAGLAAPCGEMAAGGGMSTVVSKRLGLCGDTCL